MIEIVYVYAVHNHVVVFYSPLSSVFVDVDWGWFLCFVSGVSAGLARGRGWGGPKLFLLTFYPLNYPLIHCHFS